jgi:hypothetical protein
MKKVLAIVTAGFLGISAFSQTVTVSVNGNKNNQVVVDGQTYTNTTVSRNGKKNEIVIPNLRSGQHSIQVFRANGNNRRSTELYANTFTLRPNYDLQITVNGNNGRVRMVESTNNAAYDPYGNRNNNDPYYNNNNDPYYNNNNNYRVAMAESDFNNLYQSIRGKWLPGSKMNAATSAFNNTSYNFSSAQIRQVIQLLSSEANRLDLAKLAYDNAIDPNNYYSQVYDLLSNQSSRDELNNYIRNYR